MKRRSTIALGLSLLLGSVACSGSSGDSPTGGSAGTSAGGSTGTSAGGSAGTSAGGSAGGPSGGSGGCAAHPAADLLNDNPGFEDGTFSNEWEPSAQNTDDCVIEVVTDVVRSGSHALHIQNQYVTGSNWNRCELKSRAYFGGTYATYFPRYTEFWIGFSVHLKDWSTALQTWNSIMQMHATPNNWDWSNCDTPQNTWSVSSDDGLLDESGIGEPNVNIYLRDMVTYNPYGEYGTDLELLHGDHAWWRPAAEMENRWIDIVVNWTASPDNDGKMKWWVDGELVVDRTGPNTFYYDTCNLPAEPEDLLQLGIYKSPSDTSLVEQYFDEIRIAGADGSYCAVAPRD